MGRYLFWGFILIIIIANLIRDFNRDKGKHVRAKTIHAILVSFLFLAFTGSISQGMNIIRNFSEIITNTSQAGILPREMALLVIFLNSALAIFVFFLLSKLLRRQNKSRKMLVKILPLLAIVAPLNVYRSASIDSPIDSPGEWFSVLALYLIIGGFFFGIMKIYQSPSLVRFFELDLDKGAKDMNQLEELIDQVGENEPKEDGNPSL